MKTLKDYEYFKTENGVLYCGDNMEILPLITEPIDLCLTDPPYGINAVGKHMINGTSKLKKDYYICDNWDNEIPKKEIFDLIFLKSKNQIIWGGNYFLNYLKNTRCFYIWDKTIHGNSYADCEMAWTSLKKVARIFKANMGEASMDGRVHPTQKPLKIIINCLIENEKENTIIDPFLGSGTTALACEKLNRRWIGIEISEKYCEIAKKRIEKYTSQLKLFK